ncbi:hypothetical protein CIHG_05587 [Coccidioides immitis H538.4]|uniref:Uncharacterized protein n=1 Tax=Coccidioides immitis H538.4 TaxID=396776 RepID=A0A0J8UK06_COCIT|nr:hypothetical protein CIHG_05587 [Coccidioides immitis H538.4]
MFASLLQGEDVETGQPLPGFETRRNQVSMTEKVRIKSIAESTRITILDTQDQGGPLEFDIEDEDGDGNEARDDDGDFGTGEFVADSGPGLLDILLYCSGPSLYQPRLERFWSLLTARRYDVCLSNQGYRHVIDERTNGSAGRFEQRVLWEFWKLKKEVQDSIIMCPATCRSTRFRSD